MSKLNPPSVQQAIQNATEALLTQVERILVAAHDKDPRKLDCEWHEAIEQVKKKLSNY